MFIFHLNILHGFKVLTPGQRGEVSLSSRPIMQNIHAKCYSIWICGGFLNTMKRLWCISKKAHLRNIVAVQLQTIKKALLSSERNLGFGYSSEQKRDYFKAENYVQTKLQLVLFNCKF